MKVEREKHSGNDEHSGDVMKVGEQHTAIGKSAQHWWKPSTKCRD